MDGQGGHVGFVRSVQLRLFPCELVSPFVAQHVTYRAAICNVVWRLVGFFIFWTETTSTTNSRQACKPHCAPFHNPLRPVRLRRTFHAVSPAHDYTETVRNDVHAILKQLDGEKEGQCSGAAANWVR